MTVFVTGDLEAFKEASRNCRIKLYKIYDYGETVEVKAKAGTIGFYKEYSKDSQSPLPKGRGLLREEQGQLVD